MLNFAYFALVILVSYTIGNISNALLIAKLKKVDLRASGSGNPGTMNITRTLGKKWGWLTLFLDIIKSVLACLFGWWVIGGQVGFDYTLKVGFLGFDNSDKLGLYTAGIAVCIGHIFPIFYKFKGGKGIATTIGILLVANPLATIVAFLVGLLFIWITNVGSITSFIVIGLPMTYEAFFQRLYWGSTVVPILIFCLFMITFLAHHKNIVKLFKYTEKPVVTKFKN
ncbi:MAG: glycerol-3-phosphate acyltransferase [Clostridiales bacterium]|nr:glycerol-3-phosphate acyltransferase [Clostridiales bacterium]